MQTRDISRHFDSIASEYDFWKQKNWYYYDELKSIAREMTRGAQSVLDVGCGTGAILASLGDLQGTGIDISPEMIGIAKERYLQRKNLSFFAADVASFVSPKRFRCILMFDVIEHLADPKAALDAIARLAAPGGRVVITMANPLWEPILLLGEKLGMKMPEGPHLRIAVKELLVEAEAAGLCLVHRGWRLLAPLYLPIISTWINQLLGHLPLVRRLSVIEVFVFRKPDVLGAQSQI